MSEDKIPLFKNWVRGYEDVCRIRKDRMSKEKAAEIRQQLKSMKTTKQIAIDCGVSYMQVYCILKNITFKEE